ncbi:MAG: hypothetical protein AB7G37_15100 [Solirubrobacteraceae bacterium]
MRNPIDRSSATRRLARAAAVAVAAAGFGLAAGPANAAPAPGELERAVKQLIDPSTSKATTRSAPAATADAEAEAPAFTPPFDCKERYPDAQACFSLMTTTGNVQVGGFKSSLDETPIVLTGGLDASLTPLPNPPGGAGGGGFPSIQVPGGLTGIQPLQDLLDTLGLGGLTGVSAAFVPVGSPGFSIDLANADVSADLSLYVGIQSLLLGNTCSIGTAAKSIELNLDGKVDGVEFVDGFIKVPLHVDDDTFTVPGASNCGILVGGLLTGVGFNLFDGLIDSQLGIPAASGTNHLNLTANLWLFP